MMALSRRSTKLLLSAPASQVGNWFSVRTGTGFSGTIGGFTRSIGERPISSSSSSHFMNCCSALTDVVAWLSAVRRGQEPEAGRSAGRAMYARPAGIEPATKCLEGTCSIH
jgi:hypothetical protein